MKKIIFLGVFLSVTSFIFAQSGKKELNNAYSAYSNEYYDRARIAIDKAIEFEDTKSDARTWFYRGNIYLMIELRKSTKDSLMYKKICDNCVEIAYDSYKKALQLDANVEVSSMRIPTPGKGLVIVSQMLTNQAFEVVQRAARQTDKAVQQTDFKTAFRLAEKAISATPNPDHGAIYATAYTAELLGKNDVAKTHYSTLVRAKTKIDIFPYIRLASMYRDDNDTNRAIRVMTDGAAVFLQEDSNYNVHYAKAYSIILLWAGGNEEAMTIMDKALAKYPNDHLLLVNYASELNNLKRYEDAEVYLKRALALEPNDVTANFNMGNRFYNDYVDRDQIVNQADDKSYAKLRQELDDMNLLQQAKPYLEKAHQLDPNDKNTLIMLQLVYTRLDMLDESKAIREKLNSLR